MRISGGLILVGLSAPVACSATASEPVVPEKPTRSLGLAFKPGPCVAGVNVVPASAFVFSPPQSGRYLQAADGNLQFTLVADDAPSPIAFRWLAVSDRADRAPLPVPAWNLELSFHSARAGACPIHVEFWPSASAASAGLGKAETTVVLMAGPPPPPHTSAPITPHSE